jgi:hypothetical protein
VRKNAKKIVTEINGITDHGFPVDINRYFVNSLKPLCSTGFKHSAFHPHDVLFCFYGSQNKHYFPIMTTKAFCNRK